MKNLVVLRFSVLIVAKKMIKHINKNTIFLAVVLFEIIVVIFLVQKIIKSRSILGVFHVNQMNKHQFVASASNELKYYYETKPNIEFSPLMDNASLPVFKYKLNSEGFNEEEEFPLFKGNRVYRIITLGDSFTFGLYVERKNNWSEKLENLLNNSSLCNDDRRYEIINLGVPGYDIEYSIERYKLRGQKYHPDLVIWFIKEDDFYDLNEIRLDFLPEVREEMKLSGEYESELNKGNPYPVEFKVSQIMMDKYSLREILDMNKKILEKYNFSNKLLVFTYTQTNDQLKELIDTYIRSRPNHFMTLVRSIYKPDEFIAGDGHPNEKGHAEIAKDLFEFLTETKQVICN